MAAFVAAVSHSHVISLSLAFDATLHDQFVSALRCYYPPSPHLRNINLSGIGYTLDELSIPYAALRLLTLSRVLMLYTSHHFTPPTGHSCISRHRAAYRARAFFLRIIKPIHMSNSHVFSSLSSEDHSLKSTSPLWQSLPTELQLQILQYTMPILSSTQIIHVTNYAADPNTLPKEDKTAEISVKDWLYKVGCNK